MACDEWSCCLPRVVLLKIILPMCKSNLLLSGLPRAREFSLTGQISETWSGLFFGLRSSTVARATKIFPSLRALFAVLVFSRCLGSQTDYASPCTPMTWQRHVGPRGGRGGGAGARGGGRAEGRGPGARGG